MKGECRMEKYFFLGVALLAGLTGCGDGNNLFGNVSDKDSTAAQIEEARLALNRGDCQTAINGFSAGVTESPGSVPLLLDLAASYVCRAGFDTIPLLRIAAEFALSENTVSGFSLFRAIEEGSAGVVPASWNSDTAFAVSLLSDPALTPVAGCTSAPFSNDPDTAFNRAIISQIRAVLAISSIQDSATGDVPFIGITVPLAALMGEALRSADEDVVCADSILGGVTVLDNDLAAVIGDLNTAVNDVDGILTNDPTPGEIEQFLCDQGYTVPGGSICP